MIKRTKKFICRTCLGSGIIPTAKTTCIMDMCFVCEGKGYLVLHGDVEKALNKMKKTLKQEKPLTAHK